MVYLLGLPHYVCMIYIYICGTLQKDRQCFQDGSSMMFSPSFRNVLFSYPIGGCYNGDICGHIMGIMRYMEFYLDLICCQPCV